MRSSRLFFQLLCLFIPAGLALAQTGKIAGTITDVATGDPLSGVHVFIEGTTIGTSTDIDGYFTILNARPGTCNLRASLTGYTRVMIESVEVNIGLTTEVDIVLQEETIGGEEVVITSARPIIQRDIASSQRNIDEEEIAMGRYVSVAGMMTTLVSVNDIGAYEDRPEIRGSDFDESLFLVDGVYQGDALTNQPYYSVNLDAVETVKVQTGGFEAEYGNMRSGVINVVTKEGGATYSGSVNVSYSAPGYKHFGPGLFDHDSPLVIPFVDRAAGAFEGGNAFFDGWNDIAAGLASGVAHKDAPLELYARYLWRHRSQDSIDELKRLEQAGVVQFADGVDPDDLVFQQTGVDPDYRLSATIGGPVPILDRVRFFLSYDGTQTEYAYRFPYRTYNDHNFRGKLTFNLGSGMNLNVHGFYSTQSGGGGGHGLEIGGFVSSNPFRSTGSESRFWYPNCAAPGSRTRQIYGARFRHALSASTFYEVSFTYNRTDYEVDTQLRNTAPIPGAGGVTSSTKPSGSGVDGGNLGTTAEADARAAVGWEGWENWRDWALIRIGDYWYDEAPKGSATGGFRDITGHYRMECCSFRDDETNVYGFDFSGSLTSQLNRNNQLKAGFQVHQDNLDAFYQAYQPTLSGTVWDYDADPWRGAFYIQDKLEYGGFVANIGLRFDWLMSGKHAAVLDGCDVGEQELGCDTPYTEFLQEGNTTVDVVGGRVFGIKETVINENLNARRHGQSRISPRIGISYPVKTIAKIFFNYGHFYQWADMSRMYEIEMDSRRDYRVRDFGNVLLKPEQTILYEIGYEHNILNRVNLRATGYYRDINNEADWGDFYPLGYAGSHYDMPLNMEFRDIRGMETFLEVRRGVFPYFSGWVSANYLVESGAEYGYEDYYEDSSRASRLGDIQVSRQDARPIIRANLNFHTPENFFGPFLGDVSLLGGININLLYTWRRGEAFTWNPATYPLVEDNVRWRPYRRWDLRFNKTLFKKGTISSVIYIDVTNLFNNRNMTVFSGHTDPNVTDENWAWNGHRWWKNQGRNYLESLGYTAENQNEDGSFNYTSGDPGDWSETDCELGTGGDCIDMPEFTPWTFLGRRDIFFGIRFYF